MTGITGIGMKDMEIIGCAGAARKANGFEPSPTAADFAAMIRKLAGPEMLWKEQAPEPTPEEASGDDTDARGVLASDRRVRR